ncbi:MAG TPA: hypothetical protein PLG20_08525 [Candidatus Syntrophosphaera sp.]|nr:hypothetical protein [Candidatus Syntrophosphaera sp.]
MEISEYQRMILKTRQNHTQVTWETLGRLQKAFEKAYEDVVRILAGIDGDPRLTARRQFWKMKGNQLREIAEGLKNGFADALKDGMNLVTLNAAEVAELAETMLLTSHGFDAELVSPEFQTLPLAAVDHVWKRIGTDGLTLSDRIWNLEKHVWRRIDGIVISGIARGQSAVEMAKELQREILGIKRPDDIPENLRWTSGISRSVRGRGTIHYNALRLARTEIGNAHHEADVMAAMTSKVVLGMRWNLSPAHGQYDVCDQLASQDVYGLGPGVYPPRSVPLYPHPNDMCFITREIRPIVDWGKKRLRMQPQKKFLFEHPEETSYLSPTRRAEITRTVTEKYQKSVERQFHAMIHSIVGGSRYRRVA